MHINTQAILSASLALNLLGKTYERAGEADRAEKLFQQAADLELASPELQKCWGGPFNGQVGRQAIMLDLLGLLNPSAVVETGTFRGISTEWFAQHCQEPILTCEKEKLYFLQAQARLSGYSNIDLRLGDSRQFLRENLGNLPRVKSILVYLDAHWECDLPLKEELRSIFDRQPKAVVVIDDFKVPDDPGYGWDDYGPYGSIELELIAGSIPADTHIFFPSLSSSEETGARRGCCVVASESATIVAQSALLRGNTLDVWTELQRAAPKSVQEWNSPFKNRADAPVRPEEAKTDITSSYPEQIHTLTAMVNRFQAESDARLEQIHALTAMVNRCQAESDARLEQIHTLTAMVKRSASDPADLTERYDRLIATLRIPEAPRSLRLALLLARVFRKLSASFK